MKITCEKCKQKLEIIEAPNETFYIDCPSCNNKIKINLQEIQVLRTTEPPPLQTCKILAYTFASIGSLFVIFIIAFIASYLASHI